MQIFSYTGITRDGDTEEGELNAASEAEALQQLSALGVSVLELQSGSLSIAKPWYLRDIQFGSGQYPVSETASLCEMMATLFQAHITAADVLKIAARSVEDKALRRHLKHAIAALQDGRSFTEAFFSGPLRFPPMLRIFLEVGERTSDHGTVLAHAANLFRQQATERGKVLSALVYPVILICSAIALLLLMIFFLAPNLSQIFINSQLPLPPTLNRLIGIRDFLSYNPALTIIAIAMLTFGAVFAVRTESCRALIMRGLMLIAPLKRLQYQIAAARGARHLSLLLNAGLPLTEALNALSEWGAKDVMTDSFRNASDLAEQGGDVSVAFDQNKAIPAMFTEVFRIGSQLNRLPHMMQATATALDAASDRSRERLMALLTPTLTLIIGGGIGFLVFSMMSAIMDINDIAF